MSQIFSIRRAVAAAVLTVAAAPLAAGGELPAWLLQAAATQAAATPGSPGGQVDMVARAGKSDRAAVVPAGLPSRTFSITPRGLENTSVLVRIVSGKPDRAADKKPATQLQPRQKSLSPHAACEPVVSVLTEVARQLAPGRCIT